LASTTPQRNTESGYTLDRAVLVVASVVVMGAIMSILDTTIVNVALRTLSNDFHSSLETIQWVVTGYMLALATVIPLTGWASERFGTKRVWLAAVVVFLMGSALSGAAWSDTSLIVFRVLQGFGGGMIMPVGMTILAQAAGPSRVGRVMSIVGVPMLLGPVLGPVLGGWLVQDFSWRWIFYINIPIGLVAVAMAIRLLPSSHKRTANEFDLRGFLLLSPGLALFVYGLAQVAAKGDLQNTYSVAALLGGLILIAGFVFHALRRKWALLDLSVFGDPRFSAAAMTTFLVGAALFGAMILLPLYYQVARGEGALAAGLLLAPQGLGAALVMPAAGRLSDRVGPGRVVLVGLVVAVLGTLAFTQLSANTSYIFLAAALLIRGIGVGATMMPAMAAAYQTLDHAAVPQASSTLNILQRTGGSIGTAILAVALQSNIRAALPGTGAAMGVQPIPPNLVSHLANPLANAFSQTFWVALVVTALALAPALLLLRRPTTSVPEGTDLPQNTLMAEELVN
jgi:EmrB/QacA subfamily drug resistance transporter